MRVSRARISGSMLSRLGARWVTMTKAMPGSGGMALNKYSSASTPPAEAPTPTMGNGLSIGSPGRDREKTGLPAVDGSRQGYAKIHANSKSLCRLWTATQGRFGTRQKLLRSIDRVSRRFDLFAQFRNLATAGLDQRPRLGHEVAMLGVHAIRSRGFGRSHGARPSTWAGCISTGRTGAWFRASGARACAHKAAFYKHGS